MVTAFARFSERMPLWVALGAVLGIGAGLFFGELTAPLGVFSDLYAALMQIAAIPYLLSSILHGVGSVSREQFLRLIAKGAWVYLSLLAITFTVLFCLTQALTYDNTPALVDMAAPSVSSSLLERIIPENIFTDLANNYLPALIVFTILYGLAIQNAQEKSVFLGNLTIIKGASVTIWRWVVFFAPFAVFSVLANVVGTMSFSDMVSLSSYLIAVVFGALILGFVIIPSILETLYPGVMRIVWPDLRNGLIIALTTSLSVAALPFIRDAVLRFLQEVRRHDKEKEVMVESTLSLSYPLAQLGNFFIWIFIAFAATYYRDAMSFTEAAVLPFMVLLSGIGSPSTSIDAVAFLIDWLGLPPEAVPLYSGMFSVTRYAQVMASVMGFLFMTIAAIILYEGAAQFRIKRFAVLGIPAIVLTGVVVVGISVLGSAATGPSYANYGQLSLETNHQKNLVLPPDKAPSDVPQETKRPADAPHASTVSSPPTTEPDSESGVLGQIQRRGKIRIGYNDGIIPFSYKNDRGELVGFDIDYLMRFAQDMNVEIEFHPFTWDNIDDFLRDKKIDIAAAGIYVTNARLQNTLVSEPYYSSPLALIVEAARYDQYLTRDQIVSNQQNEITVFNDPVMRQIAKDTLPGLPINVVADYITAPDLNLALWTEDQAWALALTRPDLTAVRPRLLGGTLLFAYLMPEGAEGFREYVNYWLRLQRDNGFNDLMVRKWIKADPTLDNPPRWSVLRNVLGVDWRW